MRSPAMKKYISVILCLVLVTVLFSSCSIPFFGKKNNNSSSNNTQNNSADVQNNNDGNNGSGQSDSNSGSPSGSDNSQGETPTNAAGFVDSQVAQNAYSAPADPASTLNNVADPSSDSMRFVYDEQGRIAKCYYQSNGQEVYLVYQYGEAWVEIFGFIGETLVEDKVIQLRGEFNPEYGFSVYEGFYIRGYVF